jgi:hypothetical protein
MDVNGMLLLCFMLYMILYFTDEQLQMRRVHEDANLMYTTPRAYLMPNSRLTGMFRRLAPDYTLF